MDKEEKMEDKIVKIPSNDGENMLAVHCFLPEAPCAVVQVVHGMAEHIGRYSRFAKRLNEEGIALIGHDHLGHGLTAKSDKDLGFFAKENGADLLVKDAMNVTKYIKDTFDLPVVLFGHSMGSLVSRNYISRNSSLLEGCILSGNVQDTVLLSKQICNLAAAVKGEREVSDAVNKMAFLTYQMEYAHPRTPFDWLSRDEEEVDKYINDKYCGFDFTSSAMRDVAELNYNVSGKKWIESIDKDLPIYLFSGEKDPCGGWGRGVKRIYERMKNAGIKKVSLKLYPECRHELLNELNREEITEDMVKAVKEILEGA